ncbi:actin [Thraustotheca clavata]|uniref:Actin n=1 Tax=Thraustotheca clavata TaxID=74557 RepID=A0A1V9ZXT7_9STRA|nr:actin [Thraustotheca clavata]
MSMSIVVPPLRRFAIESLLNPVHIKTEPLELRAMTFAKDLTGAYGLLDLRRDTQCFLSSCTRPATIGGLCRDHTCTMQGCRNISVIDGMCRYHGTGMDADEEGGALTTPRMKVETKRLSTSPVAKPMSSMNMIQPMSSKVYVRSRYCKVADCHKLRHKNGLCVAHGGGWYCKVEGCTKHSKAKGLCSAHGGIHYCRVEGCTKYRKKKGLCIAHGRDLFGRSDNRDMDELGAVVIDNGSGAIKIGFSGEDSPRGIFQSSLGVPRNPEWLVSHNGGLKPDRDYFVGKETLSVREHLEIVDPIQRGVITDWEAMERVWDYAFEHEMRMNPDAINMPVLFTMSPPTSKTQLEKIAQIMFESYKTSAFYSMQQCVLSLFASGRTRGIVLECGHGSSHAVPIFEGYALPHATLHLAVGGHDITKHLELLLNKNGYSLKSHHVSLFAGIKESLCFTRSDHESMPEEKSKPFELPDGSVVTINNDCRSKATDVLFDTTNLPDDHQAKNSKSLPELACQAISMCDKELQRDLKGAVVLAGGTTMIPGLSKRLHKEVTTKLQESEIRIVPDYTTRERGYNTHRKIAAWIGGSMLASLPTFKDIQITRQEWEEYHESILDRKCF